MSKLMFIIVKVIYGVANIPLAVCFLWGISMMFRTDYGESEIFYFWWPFLIPFFCFVANAALFLCNSKRCIGFFCLAVNLCIVLLVFHPIIKYIRTYAWYVFLCGPATIIIIVSYWKKAAKPLFCLTNLYLIGFVIWALYVVVDINEVAIFQLLPLMGVLIIGIGYFVILIAEHIVKKRAVQVSEDETIEQEMF